MKIVKTIFLFILMGESWILADSFLPKLDISEAEFQKNVRDRINFREVQKNEFAEQQKQYTECQQEQANTDKFVNRTLQGTGLVLTGVLLYNSYNNKNSNQSGQESPADIAAKEVLKTVGTVGLGVAAKSAEAMMGVPLECAGEAALAKLGIVKAGTDLSSGVVVFGKVITATAAAKVIIAVAVTTAAGYGLWKLIEYLDEEDAPKK